MPNPKTFNMCPLVPASFADMYWTVSARKHAYSQNVATEVLKTMFKYSHRNLDELESDQDTIFGRVGQEGKNPDISYREAQQLAAEMGCNFNKIFIDGSTMAIVESFSSVTSKKPQMANDGGSTTEDLVMQNIQAGSRMVMAYFMAQLMSWAGGGNGSLLVLGSANVDKALWPPPKKTYGSTRV